MKIHPSYALIEATRSGLNVASLGLGTVQQITAKNSLYTVITVESFSAALGLVILSHEIYYFLKETERNKEKSLYLFLRMCSLFSGIIGLALISSDLYSDDLDSPRIIGGTALIAMGIFSSRILTNSIKEERPTKSLNL